VQIDHPRLGVEVFMDIDCMPLNPFDNMPETLRMQISADKSPCMSKEPHMKGASIQPAEKALSSTEEGEDAFMI
ncbi:protein ALWAYS EARLY 2-like, partial [Trifolium medium]|nr:protein ALWAYS EARLY 2-like [Trifolium medium]